MATRKFNSVGRGESLRKHFEGLNIQEHPATTNGTNGHTSGRGFVLSTEKQPLSSPTISHPVGRGQLFAVTKSSVQNGHSGRVNGAVHPTGTSGSVGAGRASLFKKLQLDIKAQSSSSSSSTSSPPVSKSESMDLSDSTASPLHFRGTTGEEIDIVTNYIRLETEPGRSIFQYDVRFHPDVDSKQARIRLVRQLRDQLQETTNFDGTILYLPVELEDKVTELKTKMLDGTDVTVKIMKVKAMRMGDRDCIHLYNVLFRRIMHILEYVEHGRNFYDPKGAKSVPEHKLSVWPGVITAIHEFEDGVMMLCDASHRVLREQTVLELMEDIIYRCDGREEWQEEFAKLVSAQTVLTHYNNKVYRIDDVVFDKNPCDTFMKNGEQVSYVDYYRHQYGVEITDKKQPLLMSKVKRKVRGEVLEDYVYLIPELCYLSGITDSMRNDFQVMKSIAQCTRIAPGARQLLLEKFLASINNNDQARKVLEDWGLKLARRNLALKGRRLPPEVIFAANANGIANHNSNWTSHITNNGVISAINIHGWNVVCTRRDEANVRDMIMEFQKVGRNMGIKVSDPEMDVIPNDQMTYYLEKLRRLSGKQIVVVVLPLARNDKYGQIKRVCCLENPIPSQVIIAKTIRDKKKLRSVSQKIVLQMNCKLGGTLWALKIPMKNLMVIGLDTFHDPTRSHNSVGAVVASLNQELTRWYSRIYRQEAGLELIDGFEITVTQCLAAYEEKNGDLPKRLIIYRDGLGDGQLEACSTYEVNQLQRSCLRHSPNYKPEILFIVVQKRIHTRMFERGGDIRNAPPGTVLDHTVTRRDYHDFFLVSQNVMQGTVTPTHYVVVSNSTQLSPDKIQQFTYKMTHLYYNWTGPVRVPAPCQYAHKLASQVGEHLGGREADQSLRDKLYYL